MEVMYGLNQHCSSYEEFLHQFFNKALAVKWYGSEINRNLNNAIQLVHILMCCLLYQTKIKHSNDGVR